ncbi:MAG: hypothetical protein D6679_09970 [Candidatus Hydrogenedentota bacterium]|nr:MAG: hypothetical protein D6679_09970 [Candidatus Hydrogenedentota bacterium]
MPKNARKQNTKYRKTGGGTGGCEINTVDSDQGWISDRDWSKISALKILPVHFIPATITRA